MRPEMISESFLSGPATCYTFLFMGYNVRAVTEAIFGGDIHSYIEKTLASEALEAYIASGNSTYPHGYPSQWSLKNPLGRKLFMRIVRDYARVYYRKNGSYPVGSHALHSRLTVWFNPEIAALARSDEELQRDR